MLDKLPSFRGRHPAYYVGDVTHDSGHITTKRTAFHRILEVEIVFTCPVQYANARLISLRRKE
jgi:hypothetical protein